jgi:hypothetical protein
MQQPPGRTEEQNAAMAATSRFSNMTRLCFYHTQYALEETEDGKIKRRMELGQQARRVLNLPDVNQLCMAPEFEALIKDIANNNLDNAFTKESFAAMDVACRIYDFALKACQKLVYGDPVEKNNYVQRLLRISPDLLGFITPQRRREILTAAVKYVVNKDGFEDDGFKDDISVRGIDDPDAEWINEITLNPKP